MIMIMIIVIHQEVTLQIMTKNIQRSPNLGMVVESYICYVFVLNVEVKNPYFYYYI